jgi:hypothetical protein
MADITITHTPEEGTLLTGSTRGDGVWEIARQHGFRYSRQVGIYIRGSRDRKPQTWHINAAKTALEEAGHSVTLDLDEQLRSAAKREEALAERLEDRQDALDAKADRLVDRGSATVQQARTMGDAIPFGQPILVGHHSERRDRNYRNRIESTYRRGFAELEKGESAGEQAEASRRHQQYRKRGDVKERRIKELEADERRILRDMEPCKTSGIKAKPEAVGRTFTCPVCYHEQTMGETVPDHGRNVSSERGQQLLAEVRDELDFNRQHLQELVDGGQYRKWGPEDFQVGDEVLTWLGWRRVLRVNRKSLTLPTDYSWTETVPYDGVRSKRPKDEEESA